MGALSDQTAVEAWLASHVEDCPMRNGATPCICEQRRYREQRQLEREAEQLRAENYSLRNQRSALEAWLDTTKKIATEKADENARLRQALHDILHVCAGDDLDPLGMIEHRASGALAYEDGLRRSVSESEETKP